MYEHIIGDSSQACMPKIHFFLLYIREVTSVLFHFELIALLKDMKIKPK